MQKVLAAAGVASRRAAENLIAAGRVQVNGQVVTRLGTLAHPARDTIAVDGRVINRPADHRYVCLHKPAGMVTTVSDPAGRPTVLEALARPSSRQERPPSGRVYPVGRLDWDSSGLVLLTDDGDLTFRVTHPRYHLDKEYRVEVAGHPDSDAIRTLRSGVWLDGRRTAPARVEIVTRGPASTRFKVTLREGRNRQVRRMFDLAGFPVISLLRSRIGPLRLGDLPVGCWRYLSPDEIRALRVAVGLTAEDA